MLQCPVCRTDNRPGANFCKRCGSLLATQCPRCTVTLPDAAQFCDNCGLRLLEPDGQLWSRQPPTAAEASRFADEIARPDQEKATTDFISGDASSSPTRTTLQQFIPAELMGRLETAINRGAMVGERRIVTILFCDTVGSTAAAEQLDPEDWTEIINGAFEHMIRPIYRYEGTVARLMGNGLLAFFGAPIAHENDPQRAVLAGLEIQQAFAAYADRVRARWQLTLDVRVGINTGMVVVGSVGSDLRLEYTAIGDAINVAARMEQTAAPGTVQITQETFRFIEPLFEFESLGPIAAKGKEAGVIAYRVLRPAQIAGRRRGPAGVRAPLLGRDVDMNRLREAAQSAAQGVGQIVCLVGEAGLGKSRLLEELRNELSGTDGHLRWVSTACASHEATEPFALLRELLSQLSGGRRDADPDLLLNQLLALAADERKEEVAAVLDVLFGVDQNDVAYVRLSGEGFRRRLFGATVVLLEGAAQLGPLALALDDLHWADPASVDVLLELLSLTNSLPLFFLCAMRPERQAPAWRIRQEAETGHAHRTKVINIRPLDSEDSRRLVSSLLNERDVPPEVGRLILDKAAGNPYFVEEVIRSLIDRGLVEAGEDGLRWRGDGETDEIVIPDSLLSLLTARIDRLRDETRYTLQLASVIGRSFYYRVLQAVSQLGDTLPEQLDDLQRRTVIHEAARLPELEYTFHHPLMQEAAYHSILLRQRRDFHLRVAEAIEQLFADRLETFALPLARHFYEAGDERALDYFRMAGDAAMRVFANVEAAEHYGMAIQSARRMQETTVADEDLLALFNRRGRALELNSRYEDALNHFQLMMTMAQERDSQALQLAALIGQAKQRVTTNPVTDFGEGQKLLERAISLAEELGDREAEATIMWLNVLLAVFTGVEEKRFAYAERGLALARELDMKELEAFLQHDMWYVYGAQGKWREMSEALEAARNLWLQLANLPMLAASLVRMYFVRSYRGQFEQALQTAEEAYALSVEGRDPEGQVLSRGLVGAIYLEMGRIDLSLAIMDEAVSQAQSIGNVTVLSIGPAYLALGYALCGDFESAMALATQAVTFTERRFPLLSSLAQAVQGRLFLLQGDILGARRVLAQMQDFETTRRQIGFLPLAWLMGMIACAELLLAEERPDEVLEMTSEVVTRSAADDLHFLLPEVLLLQARALLALGRRAEARQALETGRAEAEAQGSRRTLWPILAQLSTLAASEERRAEAEEFRVRAVEVVQYIADHTGSSGLRASFLAQEPVSTLLGD